MRIPSQLELGTKLKSVHEHATPLASSSDALLSETETRAEPPLSHSPRLGGGGIRVSEGRVDAGTSRDGGDSSGTEP